MSIRFHLFPFSLLYGLAIRIRNFFFDIGIFKSHSFDIPIINVGNLSAGGNGKTPTTEYLIKLLKEDYNIAVLSRGYGRKTKNYLEANVDFDFSKVGDEPLQIKRKFPDVIVAVCNKRVTGVKKLLQKHPEIDVILLDDAFQHRHLKAGLNLLLTDYFHLYTKDVLLPAGRLREHSKNYKRADAILITKAPKVLSPLTVDYLKEEIKPLEDQYLFSNYISYSGFKTLDNSENEILKKNLTNIILFAGIANTTSLEEYLKTKCSTLDHIYFGDHHVFTEKDLHKVLNIYNKIISKNKILVTTEKDMMRLKSLDLQKILKGIPLYYLGMEVEFHPKPGNNFDDFILNYVSTSKSNH